MAGINKVSRGNDQVYEAVDAAIEGGLLVIPSTTTPTNAGVQGIKVATDGRADVLGVTARRSEPLASQGLSSTSEGFPVTFPNPVNELTTVYKGCVVPVTYTASAVAFGVKLASAANGQVRAYVPTTATTDHDTPDMIIGECRVVGGMSGAGGVGLALIY